MYKVIEKHISKNRYSRPSIPLLSDKPKGLVIHWVANPKSTAMKNRDYFESLKVGKKDSNDRFIYASAHEIIGLNGEVVISLPNNELAYHVGSKTYTKLTLERFDGKPNYYLYGIECCHTDWNGNMTKETYNTLTERCVDLCFEFKLDPINDIFLHQEIVGWKDCHRFFVNNPKEWIKFKNTVKNKLVERMIEMVKKAWEQELGEKSLDSLSKKGKVNNVEDWKKKDLKSESTPLWLFFTMLDRLTN